MATPHPIIALWAHPRSMSTATERIMRERGDCACFHEPFLTDYYVNRAVRQMPMLDPRPGQPTTYADARAMLLAAADQGPVFFKDMSYYVVPRLFEDEAFARRLTHSFLIRDPLRAIPSYYKIDPGITDWEIGYRAQWEHVDYVRHRLGLPVTVIEAETISADPRAAMAAYWNSVGLGFAAHAFEWRRETPEDWKYVEGWHHTAVTSTGIKPQAPRDQALAEFEAAALTAPRLRDYLANHEPAYRKLHELAGDTQSRATGDSP